MYRGDPRGGSGDTEDRCRGLLRKLPLAVSRVCDPARDTLRPEQSREAVTFRVIGLHEVISHECDCTKLPVPRGAAAAAYARSICGKRHCSTQLTCACTVWTCVTLEWKYSQPEWTSEIQNGNGSLEWNSEMEMEDPSGPSYFAVGVPLGLVFTKMLSYIGSRHRRL